MTRKKYITLSLLLWLLLPIQAVAATSVWFLYDKDNSHHQKYVDESERQLHELLPTLTVGRKGLTGESERKPASDGGGLLITVGTAAAQKGIEYNMATVNTLITRRTFDSLSSLYRSPQTAIFLEQPVARQLQLIKSALPSRHKLTVLLGGESQALSRDLSQQSQRLGMELRLINMDEENAIDNLFGTKLLPEDTLLLLPDPQVVNRRTVKPLVLGSYRQGIPLVGYSQALVKAGALMAVHSSLSVLEEQLVETTQHYFAHKVLPAPRHAAGFEVSVNYQLARALKIDLPSEVSLQKALQEQVQ